MSVRFGARRFAIPAAGLILIASCGSAAGPSPSPTAVRPTAVATSSDAMGWNSTGARRTVLPSVAASTMLLMNSKNCVA